MKAPAAASRKISHTRRHGRAPLESDIFFSISQTPVGGLMPDERGMFANFFEQAEAADRLGFGVAWLAESHLSSEVQKRGSQPVIPGWQGEVGLNCDMPQMAHAIFRRTRRMEVGSAVMNILCNGGPVAHAERIAMFAALHGHDPAELRRIHVGFSAGRFDYMNRAYGIAPASRFERALPFGLWKGKVFHEAAEIFARLLRGDTLGSDDVPERTLVRADFRSDADWQGARDAAKADGLLLAGAAPEGGDALRMPKRFVFEPLKIVPQDWRRDLVQLVVGSHDAAVHQLVNRFVPAHVANLSITPDTVIDATHERMRRWFHPGGGPWQRRYMPRTVLVFLNEEKGLSPAHTGARSRARWTPRRWARRPTTPSSGRRTTSPASLPSGTTRRTASCCGSTSSTTTRRAWCAT
jgi:hypothetical protein